MDIHNLPNAELAAQLLCLAEAFGEPTAAPIQEAAARLRLWDVPVEQLAEVRRKQAEARRESAPLRRKRVHL